jgi:uncharacterized protein GlcG (DUF336 family)
MRQTGAALKRANRGLQNMTELTLAAAQTIVATALKHARDNNYNPVAIVVLDGRGSLKASAAEDNTSLMRWKVAFGKAWGAVAWGAGSKRIEKIAVERPHFMAAAAHLMDGGILPVGGGVLIRDKDKKIIGAVGISGDTSDNDEAAGAAGIRAAGHEADGG